MKQTKIGYAPLYAWAFAFVVALGAAAWRYQHPTPARPVLAAVPLALDFSLPAADGTRVRLSDLASSGKRVVLFFLGTECPISNGYLPRLKELEATFGSRGVEFVGVSSINSETMAQVAAHAEEFGLSFRVAKDWDARVALALGVDRTAETAFIDERGQLRYLGRIDDQFDYGVRKPKPTREFLKDAVERVLAGGNPGITRTDGAGCLIIAPKATPPPKVVTYERDVRPIVDQYCVSCHRGGGIAPFRLTSYEQVKEWSAMIRETVIERRMPPWHADPRHGEFANDRSLPEAKMRLLVAWVDSGMDRGPVPRTSASRRNVAAETWRFGKPDHVFQTSTFKIPAQGLSYFERFYYQVPFDKDEWVRAVEVKAGNPRVVHHATVYVIPPGTDKPVDWDEGGFFAGMAPGYDPMRFPDGYAKRIPKGAKLFVELHYTPYGRVTEDATSVALYFAKGKNKEVRSYALGSRDFVIPKRARDYAIESGTKLDYKVEIVGLYPHAHFRGKSFRYTASLPNGEEETLLAVPTYDVNWQNYYQLKKPKELPSGTRLSCTAHFDNSAGNPRNPDPERDVPYGTRTEDEMMLCFIDYVAKEVVVR